MSRFSTRGIVAIIFLLCMCGLASHYVAADDLVIYPYAAPSVDLVSTFSGSFTCTLSLCTADNLWSIKSTSSDSLPKRITLNAFLPSGALATNAPLVWNIEPSAAKSVAAGFIQPVATNTVLRLSGSIEWYHIGGNESTSSTAFTLQYGTTANANVVSTSFTQTFIPRLTPLGGSFGSTELINPNTLAYTFSTFLALSNSTISYLQVIPHGPITIPSDPTTITCDLNGLSLQVETSYPASDVSRTSPILNLTIPSTQQLPSLQYPAYSTLQLTCSQLQVSTTEVPRLVLVWAYLANATNSRPLVPETKYASLVRTWDWNPAGQTSALRVVDNTILAVPLDASGYTIREHAQVATGSGSTESSLVLASYQVATYTLTAPWMTFPANNSYTFQIDVVEHGATLVYANWAITVFDSDQIQHSIPLTGTLSTSKSSSGTITFKSFTPKLTKLVKATSYDNTKPAILTFSYKFIWSENIESLPQSFYFSNHLSIKQSNIHANPFVPEASTTTYGWVSSSSALSRKATVGEGLFHMQAFEQDDSGSHYHHAHGFNITMNYLQFPTNSAPSAFTLSLPDRRWNFAGNFSVCHLQAEAPHGGIISAKNHLGQVLDHANGPELIFDVTLNPLYEYLLECPNGRIIPSKQDSSAADMHHILVEFSAYPLISNSITQQLDESVEETTTLQTALEAVVSDQFVYISMASIDFGAEDEEESGLAFATVTLLFLLVAFVAIIIYIVVDRRSVNALEASRAVSSSENGIPHNPGAYSEFHEQAA